MIKGIRPGTEKRCAMLRMFLDMKMPSDETEKYTSRMREKSEQEKERIAEEILKELVQGQ